MIICIHCRLVLSSAAAAAAARTKRAARERPAPDSRSSPPVSEASQRASTNQWSQQTMDGRTRAAHISDKREITTIRPSGLAVGSCYMILTSRRRLVYRIRFPDRGSRKFRRPEGLNNNNKKSYVNLALPGQVLRTPPGRGRDDDESRKKNKKKELKTRVRAGATCYATGYYATRTSARGDRGGGDKKPKQSTAYTATAPACATGVRRDQQHPPPPPPPPPTGQTKRPKTRKPPRYRRNGGARQRRVPDPVPIFRHARPLHRQMPPQPPTPNTRPHRITSFSCTRRRVIGRAPRRAGLRGGNNRFSSDLSGATVPSASRHSPPRLDRVVFN